MSVGSAPLPPQRLVFMNEEPTEIVRNAGVLMDFVTTRGAYDPRSGILDVGCGYGRIAYWLLAQDFEGWYVGCDVLREHVAWLQENLPKHSHGDMRFHHLDVRNDRYNPDGRVEATEVELPRLPESPRLVLAFSLFTHMWPGEVRHYLKQVALQMDEQSTLCATFFLMNQSWRRCEAEGRSPISMRHALDASCRYHDETNPLHAVAYEQEWVEKTLEATGLQATEVQLGSWCGRGARPTYQDTVVARLSSSRGY